MLIRRRKPRVGRVLTVLCASALLVLSTEAGARLLMWPLMRHAPPLAQGSTGGAGAIVVLAAGRYEQAPEYGGQDVPDLTALARLRYGAHLQHHTGLLVITSAKGRAEAVEPVDSAAADTSTWPFGGDAA